MKLSSRPYNLLVIAAIALSIISFFISEDIIDVHLHDTYYVIPLKFIFWTIAAILLMSWIIYRLTDRILFSKLLSWMHVIFTIVSLTFIVFPWWNRSPAPRRLYDFNSIEAPLHAVDKTNAIITLCAAILLFAQVIFIINIVFGIIKNRFDHR